VFKVWTTVINLAIKKTPLKKHEATALATQQHVAISRFLNQEPIRTTLLGGLSKGKDKEFAVLEELLWGKEPVSADYLSVACKIAKSTVSDTVKKINTYLTNIFCSTVDCLKAKNVAIRVASKDGKGGNFIGYFFLCSYTSGNRADLDVSATIEVFDDLWKNFIENELLTKLQQQATLALKEKLHSRNIKEYLPLSLQIGFLKSHIESVTPTPPCREKQKRPDDHSCCWEDFDPVILMSPQSTYILSSETGTGKTTFLRNLQLEIAKQAKFIPIFMHASKLEKVVFENLETFKSYLTAILKRDGLPIGIRDYLSKHFEKIILLVDGLDQIRGAGTDYSDLLKNLATVLKSNLVITSRPFAVISQEEQQNVNFLRVRPFDGQAQKEYFAAHYKRACEICHLCRELMAIPMLAYMVRTLIEKERDRYVKNRANLYKRFIDYIMAPDVEDGYKHDNIRSDTTIQTGVRQALAEISFKALANDKPYIQKIPVSFCSKYVKRHKVTIENILKHGLASLIVDKTDGIDKFLFFSHQSFQEYLAAEWLSLPPEKLSYILNHKFGYKWEECIKFLAGIKGVPILRQILSSSCYASEDQRVFLAWGCLEEIGELEDKEDKMFAAVLALATLSNPYLSDTSCGGLR
jgi:hypothetical protein